MFIYVEGIHQQRTFAYQNAQSRVRTLLKFLCAFRHYDSNLSTLIIKLGDFHGLLMAIPKDMFGLLNLQYSAGIVG